MKIELATIDGLPENLKALAAQDGDKFALDLSQLVPASDLEGFKAKALTAQGEAIERRKALDAWKALGESPDEIKAKLAKGADPEIVAQLRKAVDDTKSEYAGRLTKVMRERTMSDLKAELAKVGVVPEGLDLLAGHASQRVQFDEDGAVRIMTQDGKPMIGGADNGGATLPDLAKQLAASMPYLVKDAGAGGGGKPPASGGKPQAKTVTRGQFDSMSQSERSEYSKSGGKVVD